MRLLFLSDLQFFSASDFDILDRRMITRLFLFLIEPCVTQKNHIFNCFAGLICILLLAALALVIASSKLVCCLYVFGGLDLTT